MLRRVGALLASAIDWVAPRECAACGTLLESPLAFCAPCLAAIPPAPPVAEVLGVPVLAAAPYEAPLDAVVKRLKFGDRPDLAEPLAWLVSARAGPLPAADALVPVPLHATRLAQRGYDQAALLSAAIARRAGLVSRPTALCRARGTRQQARTAAPERAGNVRGAFRAQRAPQRVLLVDDVVTTGATAAECVAALTAGGASVAAILAVCRARSDG